MILVDSFHVKPQINKKKILTTSKKSLITKNYATSNGNFKDLQTLT